MSVFALRLDSQIVETPIAFDSAGKVLSITPALVDRFHLGAPAWPVTGAFVEARLYGASSGGSTLVVTRPSGALERYALSDEERAALRTAIDQAMATSGAVVSEVSPQVISQPARGAFIRNQMLLSALVYGPLLATLANDGRTGTAIYLLTVAGSYFALSALPKTLVVTRAQNHLATDGGIRGYFLANGLLTTFGGSDLDIKVYNSIGLLGSVGMSVIGFNRGRGMTDADANATTKFSTFAGLGVLGLLGMTGQVDSGHDRLVAGAMTASGIAGYLAGPLYPRRASYTVTSGDVSTLLVGAVLGVAAGVSPFVEYSGSENAPYAAATAGGLLGIIIADRALARPFDYGSSDVTQLWLGTVAGALVGGAVAVSTQPSASGATALVTAGGIAGAIAGHRFADPPRARARQSRASETGAHLGTGRMRFDPTALAFAAVRVPGQHAVLSLRF